MSYAKDREVNKSSPIGIDDYSFADRAIYWFIDKFVR